MFADPQFWVAIAFVIFIAVVFNPIRKILGSTLDNKINEIKNSINEAENLKNDAQVTLSEIKKRQNDVHKEIKIIGDEANEKIKKIEINLEQKLKDQIQKKQSLAKDKIEQLTRDANLQIQQHITFTAIEATISLLQSKLDKNEKQNLINVSINELNSALKN
tara:strand:- start:42 stop:527 length:486 start_codon:yes stop_codon:yes gene_type:complete